MTTIKASRYIKGKKSIVTLYVDGVPADEEVRLRIEWSAVVEIEDGEVLEVPVALPEEAPAFALQSKPFQAGLFG